MVAEAVLIVRRITGGALTDVELVVVSACVLMCAFGLMEMLSDAVGGREEAMEGWV